MIKITNEWDEIEYSKKIHHAIRMIINIKGRDVDIAIYPFGVIGQAVKRILNDAYGITEKYIFDETLSEYNPIVTKISDYTPEDLREVVVLIANDKITFWDEVRDTASLYFREDSIFDIFGKVCTERDVRVETLRLNAKRINELKLDGNVAEVGVYKGAFSKEINKYFPDRKLYMFDTFEGFLNERVSRETDDYFMAQMTSNYKSDYCKVQYNETILDGFPNPENCIICKGYFPETANEIEDTFVFVSLDVDIYAPTLSGLDYFWHRLSRNGIIMVHDYNNTVTKGVKKAVDEFARNNNIPVVMIADSAGSAILIKQ